MAYIQNLTTGSTITTYLTSQAKNFLIKGDSERLNINKFAISDNDYNYLKSSGTTHTLVPDLYGTNDISLKTIYGNYELKNRIPVISGSTDVYQSILESTLGFQNVNTAPTGTTTFTNEQIKVLGINRNDFENSNLHILDALNLPSTDELAIDFYNTYNNTAVRKLTNSTYIILSIDKDAATDFMDGKTIKIRLPISAGQTVNLASSFFRNSNKTLSQHNDLVSDNTEVSQTFGAKFTDTRPDSNIAYLFSDFVQEPINPSNTAQTGNTWDNGENLFTQTTTENYKAIAKYQDPNFNVVVNNFDPNNLDTTLLTSSNVDTAVGICYLEKGIIVITHPTLVNEFQSYLTTNNFNVSQPSYLDPSQLQIEANIIKEQYIQSCTVYLPNDKFNSSINPTYTDGQDIKITEVGLYNTEDELIAISKIVPPITKTSNNVYTFEIKIVI